MVLLWGFVCFLVICVCMVELWFWVFLGFCLFVFDCCLLSLGLVALEYLWFVLIVDYALVVLLVYLVVFLVCLCW